MVLPAMVPLAVMAVLHRSRARCRGRGDPLLLERSLPLGRALLRSRTDGLDRASPSLLLLLSAVSRPTGIR